MARDLDAGARAVAPEEGEILWWVMHNIKE